MMKNSEGSTLVITGFVSFFVSLFVFGYSGLGFGVATFLLILLITAGAVSIVHLRQRVKKLERQVGFLMEKAKQ